MLLYGKLYINGKCLGCSTGFGGTLRNDSKKQVPLDGGDLNIVSKYLHRFGSSIDENSIGLRNDSKKQVPLDGGHLNIISKYLHRFGSSIDENSIGFFVSKAPYKNHLQKLEEGPSEQQGISEY